MPCTLIDLAIVFAVAMVVGLPTFGASIALMVVLCLLLAMIGGCCWAVRLLLFVLRKEPHVHS